MEKKFSSAAGANSSLNYFPTGALLAGWEKHYLHRSFSPFFFPINSKRDDDVCELRLNKCNKLKTEDPSMWTLIV